MNIDLNDCNDLAKAYQGEYKGDDTYLRRISNEVKARRGEYKGFGMYLRRMNNEAKVARGKSRIKRFPTSIIVISAASLAFAGIGLLAFYDKIKRKSALIH